MSNPIFNGLAKSQNWVRSLGLGLGLLWGLMGARAEAAEVIAVSPVASCLLCNSKPTMTMFWHSAQARALLVYLPGGDGFFDLKPGQTRVNAAFVNYLASLSNSRYSKGQIDIVLMDTPEPLSPNQMYPTSRTNEDHMIRIESVIKYYRDKTGLPVWLMGHSAGGISLSHFVEYAQNKGEVGMISGVVASGVRNESYLNAPIPFPVLVIHDAEDGCYLTKPAYAKRLFDSLKKNSQQAAEFVLIPGAEPDGDPCTGGNHMYTGFEEIFTVELERFMTSQSNPFFLKQ